MFLYDRTAFSCRGSDSTSGADYRGSVEPTRTLLHRHAPVFRAADSAETSHGTPRSVHPLYPIRDPLREPPRLLSFSTLPYTPRPVKPSRFRVHASEMIAMDAVGLATPLTGTVANDIASDMNIAAFFANRFQAKRWYHSGTLRVEINAPFRARKCCAWCASVTWGGSMKMYPSTRIS